MRRRWRFEVNPVFVPQDGPEDQPEDVEQEPDDELPTLDDVNELEELANNRDSAPHDSEELINDFKEERP